MSSQHHNYQSLSQPAGDVEAVSVEDDATVEAPSVSESDSGSGLSFSSLPYQLAGMTIFVVIVVITALSAPGPVFTPKNAVLAASPAASLGSCLKFGSLFGLPPHSLAVSGVNFDDCCAQHTASYATCGTAKASADTALNQCLESKCEALIAPLPPHAPESESESKAESKAAKAAREKAALSRVKYEACVVAATAYGSYWTRFGASGYDAAQHKAGCNK